MPPEPQLEPPLRAVVRAGGGRVLDVIPIEPGESWWPAVCWAHVAIDNDRRRRASCCGDPGDCQERC